MHVLTCLASRPGQVVSREELLDTVWSKVVVNEEALTQAISQIRRVMGDDPRHPQVIQTIPKGGYRLIAPVRWVPEGETGRARSGIPRARIAAILGILIAAAATVAVMVGLPGSRSSNPPEPVALVEIPLTSFPGSEIAPAISPDGTRIAFSWKESEESNYDLYVTQKNTESPLRLTDSEANEYYASWSPDGSELAYASVSSDDISIYVIPAIGGMARKVVKPPLGIAGLDWSPDGRWLAYGSRPGPGQPVHVFLFSFDTGEPRILTAPPPGFQGDFRPVFSPDGEWIAFVRGDRTFLHDIYVIDVNGGEPERVTHSQHFVAGLDWMPDGKSLIVSSGPARIADMRLWRLSLVDRWLTWLPTTCHRPIRPSVAVSAGRMVYEDQSVSSDILEIPVGDGTSGPVTLIASTRHDYGPQYSPSGKLISFISTRSGSPQIWICNRDGSNPRQLTRFEHADIENPAWSHDDRHLAFSAAPGSRTSIYVADVESGEIERLSVSAGPEKCLGWSRDGRWLYCKSEQDRTWRVWKTRTDGDETVDIMERDVFRLAESRDGAGLIYSRTDTTGVWYASLVGEDERCIINGPGTVVPCGWRETERGVFSFCFHDGVFSLWLRNMETGADTMLASGEDLVAVNLDVCPQGEAVIVDRFEILGSDLALVEDIPR